MEGFKGFFILLVVFCLVSHGLTMSLSGKNPNEDAGVARFFEALEKRMTSLTNSHAFLSNNKCAQRRHTLFRVWDRWPGGEGGGHTINLMDKKYWPENLRMA